MLTESPYLGEGKLHGVWNVGWNEERREFGHTIFAVHHLEYFSNISPPIGQRKDADRESGNSKLAF